MQEELGEVRPLTILFNYEPFKADAFVIRMMTVFLVLLMFLSVSADSSMAGGLEVTLSGMAVPESVLRATGDGILVAVSYLTQRTEAKYIYNADNGILAVFREGDVAQLQIGNRDGWFNQECRTMACAPRMEEREVFLDLKVMADFLGCQFEVSPRRGRDGKTDILAKRLTAMYDGTRKAAVTQKDVEEAVMAPIEPVAKNNAPGRSLQAAVTGRNSADSESAANDNGDSVQSTLELPAIDQKYLISEKQGVRCYHLTRYTSKGPLSIHAVAVNTRDPRVQIKSVLGRETVLRRERTSAIAGRLNAIAAINGAFYANDGDPLGVIIDESKLLSVPIFSRSVIGFTDGGDVLVGNPFFLGNLTMPNGSKVALDGLNQPAAKNAVTLFTSEFGNSTKRYSNGTELVILRGRVIGIGKKDSVIPPDGYVVSAEGSRASLFEGIQLWDEVSIDLSLSRGWEKVRAAVGGGPRLLMSGTRYINDQEERFASSIVHRRHPRSAVGVTASGYLLMVAVDGRQAKVSVGVTLHELADLMKEFGCVDAINLDGGGSTTLYYDGKVVNSVSDSSERSVSSALVVCLGDNSPEQLAKR